MNNTTLKQWGAVLVALAGVACGPAGGGGGAPIVITANIDVATTWVPSSGDCDITVTKKIQVKSDLTIAEGTKVCFAANTGLIVAETGSLKAVGTAEKRIVFTGTSATRGFWQGLAFLSNNNANQLHFVDVSYAGSTDTHCCGFFIGNENMNAGIVLGDTNSAALVSIKNSTVSESGGMGLFAFDNSKLTGFASNTFSANAGAAVGLTPTAVSDLDAASVYSGGAAANGKNVVRVIKVSKPSTAVTLKKLDVPYAFGEGFANSVFSFSSDLTIEAGAKLEFEASSGLMMESTAKLAINGTATDRVTLTGRSATAGFWKGVALLGVNNTLTHADLTFGGNDDPFCCGFFEPGVTGNPSAKATLVVGDYNTTAAATITSVNVTQSKNRGVAVILGTLTQMGTNDLTTGNGLPNINP